MFSIAIGSILLLLSLSTLCNLAIAEEFTKANADDLINIKGNLATFIRTRLGEAETVIQSYANQLKDDVNVFAIQQRAALRLDLESFIKNNLGGSNESIIADLHELKKADARKIHTRKYTLSEGKVELQAGLYSTNLGDGAGLTNQGTYTTAIGNSAGNMNQGAFAVAMGDGAGFQNQGSRTVAIGNGAGNYYQGYYATAIGSAAGNSFQGYAATALGSYAGLSDQGQGAVALGADAGYENQGERAVSLGYKAGRINQGDYSIAIGAFAGDFGQQANSIILNASGDILDSRNTGAFYVKPMREVADYAGTKQLRYDPSTGEIFYVAPAPTSRPTIKPKAPSFKPSTRKPTFKPTCIV